MFDINNNPPAVRCSRVRITHIKSNLSAVHVQIQEWEGTKYRTGYPVVLYINDSVVIDVHSPKEVSEEAVKLQELLDEIIEFNEGEKR